MKNNINDNWYEDFFQGINCELWKKAVSGDWTKQEVDFLTDELKLKPAQHLLDIPCGFGRHSIEFEKRGFNVTGIDISQTYISALKQKIKSDNLNINAVHTDILTMSLSQKFSGAICMGNSFGYFNFNKMKVFVEKVSSVLETGARFIINSGMVAESILPNFSKNKSYTIENIKMDITNIYNVDDSYMNSHILYTKENKTEEHSFKHYVFTIAEIKRLLKLYSLKTIATYSSPNRTPF
ncbi:MAG: methyltransferase domain-containing protein, partial [Bacteroidota bacterium]|nr:methyltransferase domain-containing protein [Bacteroidota bacterium]